MRRDKIEPLALLRLGYGRYGLSQLARDEMQFEASLTAAMVSGTRRARFSDDGWADTCKSKSNVSDAFVEVKEMVVRMRQVVS